MYSIRNDGAWWQYAWSMVHTWGYLLGMTLKFLPHDIWLLNVGCQH